ncbi:hypothetical protein CYFUS_004900 [Cystobacter fuscus]|uniref:Uncharacterized protein n=1 Tax=Cystobacter fuscus TaxID=43 RepID=A0A250J8D4_9BACT|nr:hypothetical protein [Cystobacter fuscus]ATB39456.1 hypothetical protein CYFUS_004900 [Cystobacter fuscus]
MTENMEVKFESLSRQVARLDVNRLTSPFGLTVDPRTQIHHLGYHEAPLFRLEQPFSPDDAWGVEPLSSGRFVRAQPEAGQKLPQAYLDWLRGSAVSRGLEIPWSLPPGSYLLVRTARPLHKVQKVLLGNELVPATPNIRVLREQKPVYSCVVGARLQEPPVLDQPLIGLSVLNYDGSTRQQGMLFFSSVEAAPHGLPAGQELVLIVPLEGQLVFDNMGFFSAKGEVESRRRWKEELAHEFVTWCTDPSRA